MDPPGTNTILDGLENDLLDEVDDEDDTTNEDGSEGAAIKAAFNRFKQQINAKIRS